MKKVNRKSANIVKSNIEQLKSLFPEIFSDGKINFDQLRELLGDHVVQDEDHYNFTWYGKRQAGRLAQTPSTGTLRPCKEESVNWDTTQNLFIEGDNLEVLKLLQKSYHRKVKMIYIDPPYNTGNDFVYEDDFKDGIKNYLQITGQVDGNGKKLGTNSNAAGRYHTNWLNMMYPRLKLARNLLRDDGIIFISIDDNEQANLKKLCDEVFGEENLIVQICHKSRASVSNDKIISPNHNIILAYAKNERIVFNDRANFGLDPDLGSFNNQDENGFYKLVPVDGPGGGKKGNPHYTFEGVTGYWRFSEKVMRDKYENGIVVKVGNSLQQKYYKHDAEKSRKTITSWWDEKLYNSEATKNLNILLGGNYFDSPKSIELIKKMIKLLAREPEDLILDFFAGSGTTAHAMMQLNVEVGYSSRCISIQLPELIDDTEKKRKDNAEAIKFLQKLNKPINIAEISKERIRRAAKKIKAENPDYQGDLGFKVFKLDSSNIKRWESSFATLEADLSRAADHIKADRSSEDLLYELLLKYGLDLTVPITTRTIADKAIHCIGSGELIVCLDDNITTEVVKGIGELKEKLQPETMRVVFRDDGFKDDVVKTNALQTLKYYGIEDVKSL